MATSMLLILLEVSVKVTRWLTRVSVCSQKSYFHATYPADSISENDSVYESLMTTSMLLCLLEVSVKVTHWHVETLAWK